MGDSVNKVGLIEELAANAWPALFQQQLGGWRLRASGNVTKRANSVLALGETPAYEGWFEAVVGFYGRRGLPIRFQVSEATPPGLDGMLDGLGFVGEASTSVQTAPCAMVLESVGSFRQYEVRSSDRLVEDWLDSFMLIEGFEEWKRETYRRIMSAIGPRARFVQVVENEKCIGVGMAVLERGWAGLFNIATAAEHRQKGVAAQMVGELAEWSLQNGAVDLYLQVMESNEAAVRLYSGLGFSHLYGYHYRSKQG